MASFAQGLMARILGGQAPDPVQPEGTQDIMDPRYRDPLGSKEFDRGGFRAVLDGVLGLPDAVTAGANRVPGFAGAMLRTATGGVSKLPSDAAAEGLDAVGQGPAYETGRSLGQGLLGLTGLATSKAKVPAKGQVNMLIGPGNPGYDEIKLRQALLDWQDIGITQDQLRDQKLLSSLLSSNKMVYDPISRKALQYLDTSNWWLRPRDSVLNDLLDANKTGRRVTLRDLLVQEPDNFQKIKGAVRGTNVKFDRELIDGAAYNPSSNTIHLSHGSFAPNEGDTFRQHLFHELQHSQSRADNTASGTNLKTVKSNNTNFHNFRQGRLDRYVDLREIHGINRKTIPPNYRDFTGKLQVADPAYQGYMDDVGEQFAREAEQTSVNGIPRDALNIYQRLRSPSREGVPVDLVDHLTRVQMRHPTLYRRLPAELLNITTNPTLRSEAFLGRGLLGLPGQPSPEKTFTEMLRRGRQANWDDVPLPSPGD